MLLKQVHTIFTQNNNHVKLPHPDMFEKKTFSTKTFF